jgi:hypothetical protein
MKESIRKKLIIFIICGLLAIPASPLLALVTFYETNPEFNPNNIVSDIALTDYNSMTREQIRDFVINKGGTLGTYVDPVRGMPAYWIIWEVAQEFRINPKFVLAMLQKEQSLVTDPEPSDNQYNWAVGYSCYGGICLDKYKGFGAQLRAMANKFMNDYLVDLNTLGKHQKNFYCSFTKWCVGVAKETQDEQLITPENKVTAALYTYNPYRGGTSIDGYRVGANYNFWKIWNGWFAKESFRPNGALLKAKGDSKVYLIQNGQKRPFATWSSFITRFDPSKIVEVEPAELGAYEIGTEIKFPQYSLLENSSGDIYLLIDDSLRHIDSIEVFRTLGFNPEEVERVADVDLAGLTIGQPITLKSAYPTGALIQDASSGGVYYVQFGVKYPIISPEILKNNYPNQTILSAHGDELDKYPKGEAVNFKDGTLIKSKDSDIVYVVSDGKKLPIADEKSFISRGYKWTDIITTSQRAVDLHPSGETLEFIDQSLIPLSSQPEEILPATPGESASTSNEVIFDEVESLNDNPF